MSGSRRDHRHAHPTHPMLIVEVADSSLEIDRSEKAGLYARAGIVDYWIVNLMESVLEVYRDPVADSVRPYGWRYASAVTLRAGDSVTPLGAPAARIAVADLLL